MTSMQKNNAYCMPELKYGEIIREILHTPESSAYETLRLIQEATEFKRKIPKSYIENEAYRYVVSDFGIDFSKNQVKVLREEIICEIIKVILKFDKTDRNEEMLPDHYARLFHALSILKVPKDTKLLPGTTKNLMYNAIYIIWGFDDGSDNAGNLIQRASWHIAEEIKKRDGKRSPQEDNNLIIGLRH